MTLAITMITPTVRERADMAASFRRCTPGLPTVDFSRSMPATIIAGLAYRRECSSAALPAPLLTLMQQPSFRLLEGVRQFAPWKNAIEVATRSDEAFAGEHRHSLALGAARSGSGVQLVCVKQVAGSDFFTAEMPPEAGEPISDCLADIAESPKRR